MSKVTLTDVSKKLTKDVIHKAFITKINSKIDIRNVQIVLVTPLGEGLISGVYRIVVEGNNGSASFVAKGLVHDALLRKTLRCSLFFKREIFFYSKILPSFIDLQKSLEAKEKIQDSVPICYQYYSDGDNDYLLLEDMTDNGYATISRSPKEFERNEVLKVLAHLHAVSMVLRIRSPYLFTKLANELSEVYYSEENRLWYTPYLQRAIELDIDVLKSDKRINNTIYYKKFLKLTSEDPYNKIVELITTRGDHPVFNHGDAWSPNFLCSKKRAVAIDFQIFRLASPAIDLSYFTLLCSNLCQNKEDFIKALDVYYSYLVFYLSDMKVNPEEVFTKQMLYSEIKIFGKFGLLAAITSIPLLTSEKCNVLSDFEKDYTGLERIPLEELWKLTAIEDVGMKECLVNAVRVAVDAGLI